MNGNPKEITLAKEQLHWGIFIPPLLLVVLLLMPTLAMLSFVHLMSNMIGQLSPQSGHFGDAFLFLLVLIPDIFICPSLLIFTWAAYVKSEITLTNRRLLFRTGFVMRVAGELPLENIEAIIIVEPLLGRVFGYGTVIVTSVGGLRFPLRYIGTPQTFLAILQKAVNDAKRPVQSAPKVSAPSQGDDSRYMPKG